VASSQRYVEVGSGIAKASSQSKVDEIYLLVSSNHKIIRLDVTMDIAMIMKGFQGMQLNKFLKY
jgi:hypothetical protein